MRDLRDNFGVTVIYITHDLATAYYISNRIVIMQKGHIVKMGSAQAILEAPEHLYASLLKNSVLPIDEAGHGKVQSPDRNLSQAAAEQSGSGILVEGTGGRKVRRYEVVKPAPKSPGTPARDSAARCRRSRSDPDEPVAASPYPLPLMA